jgi:hypothetical protein
MLVTPEMASDWLSTRSPEWQRSLIAGAVDDIQRDIQAGAFEATHQAVAFTTEGYILDGRHRFSAIANGGKAVHLWVWTNRTKDEYDKIDVGRRRLAAHLLTGQKHRFSVAAAARIVAFADGTHPASRNGRHTAMLNNRESLEVIQAWPELRDQVENASRIKSGVAAIPMAASLALLAQASRTEHRDKIKDWVEALHSGAGLEVTDPRLRLIRLFNGAQRTVTTATQTRVYSVLVKGWNLYVQDRKVQIILWKEEHDIPKVVGFKPTVERKR